MRKQCFILAANAHTPVDYWLALELDELAEWIAVNNDVMRDRERG